MDRVKLKEKAKVSLDGKFWDAAALIGITLGISMLVGFVLGFLSGMLLLEDVVSDFLSEFATIALSCLLGFGTTSYFLKVSRNQEVNYNELFSKMNMWSSYLSISLLVGLFTLLWTLAFIIPGIIAALNYSMVFYIKLDNPDMSAMDVLKRSKQIMYGHKTEFFVLGLSFLGWLILGAFTLGILYIWLYPYMEVTYANFYNRIKDGNKATI